AAPPTSPPPSLAVASGGDTSSVGAVIAASGATNGAVGAAPPEPAPVRVGGNIAAPALLSQVQPVYPEQARHSGLAGVVVLEATVNASGYVENVHVVKSAGIFDRPAVDAVKGWRYAPLKLNGTPMPFILTVTVTFHG